MSGVNNRGGVQIPDLFHLTAVCRAELHGQDSMRSAGAAACGCPDHGRGRSTGMLSVGSCSGPQHYPHRVAAAACV